MTESVGDISPSVDRGVDVSHPHRQVIEEAQRRLTEVGGPDGKVDFAGTFGGDVTFVLINNPTAAEGQPQNHLFVGPVGETQECSDVSITGMRQGATIVSGIETVEQDEGDPMRFGHVVSYQGDRVLWGVAQINDGQDKDDVIDEILQDFETGDVHEDDRWGTIAITRVQMPQ